MNYLNANIALLESFKDLKHKRFLIKIRKCFNSKVIVSKNISGIILFNGPSRVDNLNIYILKDNKWILGESEDRNDLEQAILTRYKLKDNLNKYVGFIGFETNNKFMVYKVKDTENVRSNGARCDQSGKEKTINLLNNIEGYIKYSKENKEIGGVVELCVRQELTLRLFEKEKRENKTWFVDTETAIINEFDLVDALEKNIIMGAGLDVYDIEPLPENHKLRFLPNALLLTHLGYVTKENYEVFYTQMAQNLLAFKEGKPIRVIQMLN